MTVSPQWLKGSTRLARWILIATAYATAPAAGAHDGVERNGWADGDTHRAYGAEPRSRTRRSDAHEPRHRYVNPYASSADRARLYRDPYSAYRGYQQQRRSDHQRHHRRYERERGYHPYGYGGGALRYGIRGGAGRATGPSSRRYRGPGTPRTYAGPRSGPGGTARGFHGPVLRGTPSAPPPLRPFRHGR